MCTTMTSQIMILVSALTISIAFYPNNASAFTIQLAHLNKPHTPSIKTNTCHQATIISWDDDTNSYKSTFDEPSTDAETNHLHMPISHLSSTAHHIYTSIADSLSQSRDKIASLARLAVAFSPPEQAVKLEDINQIHILKVTNSHIEISIVVCDDSQCITLLVPVGFRNDCSCCGDSDDATLDCVIDNISALDAEAQRILQRRDLDLNHVANSAEVINALHSRNNLDLPSWWTYPKSREMSEECNQIQNILNQENFQVQVRALASKGLAFYEDGKKYEIHRANVSSVGSSGLYFRVFASQSKEGSQLSILDVPLKISSQELIYPSDLRAAVLRAVASVE